MMLGHELLGATRKHGCVRNTGSRAVERRPSAFIQIKLFAHSPTGNGLVTTIVKGSFLLVEVVMVLMGIISTRECALTQSRRRSREVSGLCWRKVAIKAIIRLISSAGYLAAMHAN